MAPPNRRVFPRVDVRDQRIQITEIGVPYDVRLLDVSAGGIQVSTPVPYVIGAIRDFEFRRADGQWSAVLRAKAVYCYTSDAQRGWPEYHTGFAFVTPENRAVMLTIVELMTHATEGLRFIE